MVNVVSGEMWATWLRSTYCCWKAGDGRGRGRGYSRSLLGKMVVVAAVVVVGAVGGGTNDGRCRRCCYHRRDSWGDGDWSHQW